MHYKKCTKEISTTDPTPEVDRHLIHLWEARRELAKRKRLKHNIKLKINIG